MKFNNFKKLFCVLTLLFVYLISDFNLDAKGKAKPQKVHQVKNKHKKKKKKQAPKRLAKKKAKKVKTVKTNKKIKKKKVKKTNIKKSVRRKQVKKVSNFGNKSSIVQKPAVVSKPPVVNRAQTQAGLRQITHDIYYLYRLQRSFDGLQNFISTVDRGDFDGTFAGEIARVFDRVKATRKLLVDLSQEPAAIAQLLNRIDQHNHPMQIVAQDNIKDDDCAICFESLRAVSTQGPVVMLNCSGHHQFHRGCIEEELKHRPACPYDRAFMPSPIPNVNESYQIYDGLGVAGYYPDYQLVQREVTAFLGGNRSAVRPILARHETVVHGWQTVEGMIRVVLD